MAEYSASQITITNGSKAVVIESGESPENVRQGDFLFVTGSDPVAINRTYINASNKHVIELTKNWGQGNKNNQPAIVLPSTAEYKAVADALKNANLLVNDNFVAMQDWQTKTGTVTFVNIDGTTTTVKTLKQIESEAQAQLDAYHPYPWAMRKVEFEARRQDNIRSNQASGFIHLGKETTSADINIADGVWVDANGIPNLINIGRVAQDANTGGVSETGEAVVQIAGVVFHLIGLATEQAHKQASIFFPPVEDGVRTYDSSTGVSVTHATPAIAFASETATNKVVTNRYDMWGFEFKIVKITDDDPFVYPYGLTQYALGKIDGINTSENTFRPKSYFRFHDTDVRRGKGINWNQASEEEKIKFASNPKHNVYFDDATGSFYQGQLVGRTFAGAGNGVWSDIESYKQDQAYMPPLSFDGKMIVKPRGALDPLGNDVAQFNDDITGSFANIHNQTFINNYNGRNAKELKGLFVATQSGANVAQNLGVEDGECYFLVCGLFNRMNKGAYHPQNPLGTSWFGSPDDNGYRRNWFSSNAYQIEDISECFISAADGGAKSTSVAPTVQSTGVIVNAEGYLPRHDGRFSDYFYSGGCGGLVKDLRFKSKGITITDATQKINQIHDGEAFRGLECVTFCQAFETQTAVANNTFIDFDNGRPDISIGDFLYCETADGTYKKTIVDAFGDDYIRTSEKNGCIVNGKVVIQRRTTDLQLSGSYLFYDVVADPSAIMADNYFKNGWYGGWVDPMQNVANRVKMSRKWLSSLATNRLWRLEAEHNFSLSSTTPEASKNNAFVDVNHNMSVLMYDVWAGVTQRLESSVGENLISLDVFYTFRDLWNFGSLLCESLIQKVLDQSYTAKHKGYASVTNVNKSPIGSGFSELQHTPIVLDVISEGKRGFKCFSSVIYDSGMAYGCFNYRELISDGSSWGDDSALVQTFGQAMTVDDNGQTVLTGTNISAQPLGWIRNDK